MTVSNDTPSPWLSIVGIGEDGLDGLSVAARELLANADLIVGGRRHLALVASLGRPTLEWEVPFAASIPKLLGHRGRHVVALCSGDPFWHGAGAVIASPCRPRKPSPYQLHRPSRGLRRGCAGGSKTPLRSACMLDRSNYCDRICAMVLACSCWCAMAWLLPRSQIT